MLNSLNQDQLNQELSILFGIICAYFHYNNNIMTFIFLFWIKLQISFTISYEFIPGRMTLLITILLCLINIFNSITSESPYAKSFTSISTWMIVCILFVTSTLLQYGAILLFWKYTESHKENFKMILKKIDMVCVTIETLAFMLFNLIFWNFWKSFFWK